MSYFCHPLGDRLQGEHQQPTVNNSWLQEHPTTVSGLPYEEYEPIYADVDALRRGSFCELYVHVSRTGNLSRKFASVSPLSRCSHTKDYR